MEINVDVLVAGTGIAGLFCALNLRDDLNVLMITKTTLEECNTYLAQGGISTVLNEEDKKIFIEDTLKAGMYLNDKEAVKILASEANENINRLEKLGVKFDKNGDNYEYTSEGGHSVKRIVHCADRTGRRIFEALAEKVSKKNNIKIEENTNLIDIITEDNRCLGAFATKGNKVIKINAKIIVLATGGIGGIFKRSTNQTILKGTSVAIALRRNIKVDDLSYIQFHPTGLYEKNAINEKSFLISETLRGEGAILTNKNGQRFVNELEPRNVVSKAIIKEEEKTGSEFVYLDISFLDRNFIKNRFPLIYEECLKRGIDITKEKIPVTPVQHYFMGGIKVNSCSLTSMENLLACGETSCTGVHGGNRLASNSLLEAVVFSKRAAEYINHNIDKINVHTNNINLPIEEAKVIEEKDFKTVINQIKKCRGDLKNELVSY